MPAQQQVQKILQLLKHEPPAKLISIVFAILLAYSIIQFIVALWPSKPTSDTDLLLQATVKPLPDVAGWHLFGDYGIIRAGLLPKTQLDLKLEGIFYSTEPSRSIILVAAPNVPVKLYKVGDELPGGARVKEILANGVIITYDNQLQNLPLKESKLNFLPKPKGLDSFE